MSLSKTLGENGWEVELDPDAFNVTGRTNPTTGLQELLGPGGVIDAVSPLKVRDQLVTVAIGNSISAQDKYDNVNKRFSTKSIVQHAIEFSGAAMRFKRMTASTRTDIFGVYGYDGATIASILSDLEGQLWSSLRTADIVPDLILALSLTENSIAGGASTASITASIKQFVRTCQSLYPGVMIVLGTPLPSFSYNSAAKVLVYQEVKAFTLALDNNYDIFVCDNSVYENPDSPATPLGTTGSPIYTDASVHPNARGGMLLGRLLAATLKRVAIAFKSPGHGVSDNPALSGTQAATGTNVSGTKPTGILYAGDADGVYVLTAENPGFLYQITCGPTAGPAPLDHGSFNTTSVSISGATLISPFMVFEVVSGAENIYCIQLTSEVVDGSGTRYIKGMEQQTTDAEPDYQNGDVITVFLPPDVPTTGTFVSALNYAKVRLKLAGGTCSVRVLKHGFMRLA